MWCGFSSQSEIRTCGVLPKSSRNDQIGSGKGSIVVFGGRERCRERQASRGRNRKTNFSSGNVHRKARKTREDQLPRCVEFPEMMHGWVSREDTNLEAVRKDAEDALKIAANFFRAWM